MSVGGIDVVLLAPADECLGDMILRVCRRLWPKETCFFQDVRDETVHSFDEPWVWIAGTSSNEFFVYRNERAVHSWEDGPTAANVNTMLHFIIGDVKPGTAGNLEVALVCDKLTHEMKRLIVDLTATFLSGVPSARVREAA